MRFRFQMVSRHPPIPCLTQADPTLAAVDKAADTENGFLDTKLRDLETAFGTRLTLEKKDRLRAYDTSMTQ